MIPFVRDLAWQFAQIDDDEYANKNQDREHDKGERVQHAE